MGISQGKIVERSLCRGMLERCPSGQHCPTRMAVWLLFDNAKVTIKDLTLNGGPRIMVRYLFF